MYEATDAYHVNNRRKLCMLLCTTDEPFWKVGRMLMQEGDTALVREKFRTK